MKVNFEYNCKHRTKSRGYNMKFWWKAQNGNHKKFHEWEKSNLLSGRQLISTAKKKLERRHFIV